MPRILYRIEIFLTTSGTNELEYMAIIVSLYNVYTNKQKIIHTCRKKIKADTSFFLNTYTNSINNDYTNTLLIKFRGTIFYAYFLLTVNSFECVDEYCKHCCRWLILCFELNKEQKCEVRYIDNKLR